VISLSNFNGPISFYLFFLPQPSNPINFIHNIDIFSQNFPTLQIPFIWGWIKNKRWNLGWKIRDNFMDNFYEYFLFGPSLNDLSTLIINIRYFLHSNFLKKKWYWKPNLSKHVNCIIWVPRIWKILNRIDYQLM
jgi:hypothetical protein